MAVEERSGRRRMIERVRERRDAHKERSRIYRIVFGTFGFIVLLGGVVLSLPFVPGPGVLLIAIGLGMLALEFAWAENLLEKVIVRLEAAGERAARATPLQRALLAVAIVAVAAAAVAAAVLWDLPLVPV